MQRTTACDVLDGILRSATSIEWTDAGQAHPAISEMFDRILAEDELLATVVDRTIASRGSAGECESFPALDKLVLWQSADRSVRLRLHVFFPGYHDRPHNHRWSFASRILRGRYVHALYGLEDGVWAAAERGIMPTARYVSEERAGYGYFLDSSLVHSLHADTVTVTLLLRGPAVKDDYFSLEGAANSVRHGVGANQESAEDRLTKAMTEEGFSRVRTTLEQQGLLGRAS
jgi:hypothetical protein